MLDLREYARRRAVLADYLPWAALVAPGVILNKDGAFQRTARFRGPDLDSASDEAVAVIAARINNVLRRLGSGWALFVEARRAARPRLQQALSSWAASHIGRRRLPTYKQVRLLVASKGALIGTSPTRRWLRARPSIAP